MMVEAARSWLASGAADIAALRAGWGSPRGGWRTAWRDTAELVRQRQIVVATPAGGESILLTRIRLTGETETCVRRAWLEVTPASDIEATAKAHFAAVVQATGGWPAALGMVRLGSRVAGIVGVIAAAQQEIRGLLNHGFVSPLPTLLLNWPVLLGLGLLIVGRIARPLLRRWLAALICRVPLHVPKSATASSD